MKVKYHPIRGLDDSIGVPSTLVDYIEDDQCEGSSKITGIYLHLLLFAIMLATLPFWAEIKI